MGSIKKGIGALLLAGVIAAGGFAVSVALGATKTSGWTTGNCGGAAENTAAPTANVKATFNAYTKSGTCVVTVSGKFSKLPTKNVPITAWVKMSASSGVPHTYTGTIKTAIFSGTLQIVNQQNPSGCGWTFVWMGGHYVAMYTTC